MHKIHILIADDHAIVRQGLRSALAIDSEIEVVGEAETGIEAVDNAEKLCPDIILMDINMPEMDGIKASRKIKNSMPKIKILVLTMYDNKHFILDALSAGIDGYLYKMADVKEVLKAIKEISIGNTYFDPEITQLLKSSQFKNEISEGTKQNELTGREIQIVSLIAKGLTANEIADNLAISYSTVKNHRHNILKKLNLKNTAEIVRYAIKEGYSI